MRVMARDDNTGLDSVGAGELPVSPRVLALYKQIRQTQSKAERAQLMMELAAIFAAEHDPTDDTATDDFHGYLEEYEQAKLRFQQAGLRVARLAMDCIDTYAESTGRPIEEVVNRNVPN